MKSGGGFDGFPDKYDADQASAAVRQLEQDLRKEISDSRDDMERAIPDVPDAPVVPTYTQVRRLSLRNRSGTYGGEQDPRVADVEQVSGRGLSANGRFQRFRFGLGTQLVPFATGGVCNTDFAWVGPGVNVYTGAASPVPVIAATVVTRIPHALGRLPERCVARMSSGRKGPSGQRVEVTGGSYGSPWQSGSNVRADVDFIPVLGVEPDDIERVLKHLVGFGDGSSRLSEHGFAAAGTYAAASRLENPDLHRALSGELVTTEDTFGGLLILTTWGFASWQQNQAGFSAVAPANGGWRGLAGVSDPVTLKEDMMAAIALPEIGKSACALGLPSGAGSLQTIFDTGFQVSLMAGTVDFVMG